MEQEDIITQEELGCIFDYNPITGTLVRINSCGKRPAGSVAGGIDGRGYLRCRHKYKHYAVLRTLELFDRKEDAIKARKEGEGKYNFHENHGNRIKRI